MNKHTHTHSDFHLEIADSLQDRDDSLFSEGYLDQGWHVSSMDGKNHGKNRVFFLSILGRNGKIQKWYKIIIQI